MKTQLFDYPLPEELIADYPPPKRDGGRLMIVDKQGGVFHEKISELYKVIPENALLVANNSAVFPARLEARKPTGGAVEVLLVRLEEQGHNTCKWAAMCKSAKPLKKGDILLLPGAELQVLQKDNYLVSLSVNLSCTAFRSLIEEIGKVPLPPYIKRKPEPSDKQRYQTVFASKEGSVAAPTAGLHLTDELLEKMKKRGIDIDFVTLHVGPGTFRPVLCDDVKDHVMDEEYFCLSDQLVSKIADAKKTGRPIVAVGTTTVRALEGCVEQIGKLAPGNYKTDIFITPPYEFKVIDGLLTNFHLPKSTLLCLVSALRTRQMILGAYKEAVEKKYRFYSYGDAMLLLPGGRK